MEIKRYSSIYFLVREMRKDLFGIDTNNSTDGVGLLFPKMTNFIFHQSVKKSIPINGKKLTNFFLSVPIITFNELPR
jgi:hypothetical protein